MLQNFRRCLRQSKTHNVSIHAHIEMPGTFLKDFTIDSGSTLYVVYARGTSRCRFRLERGGRKLTGSNNTPRYVDNGGSYFLITYVTSIVAGMSRT